MVRYTPQPLDSRFRGCVNTLLRGDQTPIRHSRESGNPGVVAGRYSGVSPLYPSWIPAFAGMTFLGVVASLEWCFDTACSAGMTSAGARGGGSAS